MKSKYLQGFTLVELLVVISIISILASIIIPNLNSARAKARDAKRLRDMDQFMIALNLFYDKYGVYPCGDSFSLTYNVHVDSSLSCPFLEGNNGSTSDPEITCVHSANSRCVGIQQGVFGGSVGELFYPKYDARDPLQDANHFYFYSATPDRQDYLLQTVLETDLEKMENDGGICSKIYEVGSGLGNYNLTRVAKISSLLGFNCN